MMLDDVTDGHLCHVETFDTYVSCPVGKKNANLKNKPNRKQEGDEKEIIMSRSYFLNIFNVNVIERREAAHQQQAPVGLGTAPALCAHRLINNLFFFFLAYSFFF